MSTFRPAASSLVNFNNTLSTISTIRLFMYISRSHQDKNQRLSRHHSSYSLGVVNTKSTRRTYTRQGRNQNNQSEGAKAQPAVTSLVPILVNLRTRLRYPKALVQARRKQNCIGPSYRYTNTRVATLLRISVYAKARGVWGHAPPKNIFDFDVVRWLLRLFLGGPNITTNLCFSPGLVTGF